MQKSENWRASLVCGLLASVALPHVAYAQLEPEEVSSVSDDVDVAAKEAEPRTLGTVLVTAQRKSESLLSVPVAVTAIGGDDLAQQGLAEPGDLRSLVPNLQVNDSTGGAEPNFTLRGIGVGNDYSSNQASPVGVYVDDAYLAFRATHGAQMFDLERVEVLRGPQGTLFGRNTTGGAINFITKKPGLSGSDGYVEIGYGNFNDFKVDAAGEATLQEGVLGVRAAISYNSRDGFVENKLSGAPDLADADNLRTRVSFRLQPSEALDLNLRLFYNSAEQIQPGIIVQGIGPGGANPVTGYIRQGLDFYEIESDNPHRNETNSAGAVLTAKYDLSETLSLQSLTAYTDADSLFGQDVDGQPVSLLETVFSTDYEDFSQEIRLVYDGDAFSAQGGVYYGRDEAVISNQYDFLGFLEGVVPADPFLVNGGATIDQGYRQNRESTAVFGQADFYLTDNLTLTAGVRYTEDTAEYKDGISTIGDYDFTPIVTVIGDGAPLNQSGSSDAVTGRLALSYEFSDGGLIYGSYSRGYRAGTFNGSAYLDPAQVAFVDPEEVDAFEFGAKGQFFSGALTLAGAAFYYDYKDQHIQDFVGVAAFLRNAGASTLQGFEVEGALSVSDNLNFFGSIGYTDGEYDDLTLQDTSLSGNELPFVPPVTANARFEYYIRNVLGGDVLISPSITFTDEYWFTPYNGVLGNGALRQEAYTAVDLFVEWERDDWAVRLWGKNLGEEEFYTYGINLQGFGFDYYNTNQPRTYGIAVKKQF